MEFQTFINQIEKKYNCKISKEAVLGISEISYKKSFKKNDIVSNIGDKDYEFIFLLSGLIRLYYIDV